MAENLNTLYYALGLDDHEMQEGLKKAIQNLSVLDDEFNKINDAIRKTFGKKIQNAPIHNEIKGLKGELQALEKQWNALTLAERRGSEGQRIRAEYEALRKEAGNLNNSLARLYSESQKAASGQKGLAAQFGLVNKELTLQSRLMSNVKTLFTTYVSIFAVKSFIQNLAQVRGEFENQQIALRAILRDAEAADKIFSQIKSFAVVSPFEFKDLVGYAKQLSAFQVPVNELFETTKRLADVSAGLGVGMDRIILAYGQVRSAAVLRGQELRQFTEAGIPLVDELAKKFSELEGRVVSAGDVFEKISNRMVSFEMVKEIFEDMTNEGGMFYMMQEKQAESLKGKIANLADAYDIMLNDIGQANDGILKGGVEGIAALMQNWEKVWKVLKSLIIGYGTYKTVIIAVNVAQKANIGLNVVSNFIQMSKVMSIATKQTNLFATAQNILNKTLLSNPYTAIAVALGTIVGSLILFSKETETVTDRIEKLEQSTQIFTDSGTKIDKLISNYEELSSKTDRTDSENKKLTVTMNELNNVVPNVAKSFDEYGNVLDINIEKVKQFTEAERKANKQRLEENLVSSEQDIENLKKAINERTKILSMGGQMVTKTQYAGETTVSYEIWEALDSSKRNEILDSLKNLRETLSKVESKAYDAKVALGIIVPPIKESKDFAISIQDLNDKLDKLSGKYKEEEINIAKVTDKEKTLNQAKEETITMYKQYESAYNGYLESQKAGLKINESEMNSSKKRMELFKERAKILGILDELENKKGGSTKDPNVERLKEQIDLIKKAQAQYEKYLQIMSPNEALKSIQTDKQFMALDVQFEPDKVRERLQMVMNDIGKLPQSPELEKLKKSLQSTFTDIDYTDAKKNFDQFLSDLTKDIDAYKDKYNFYEQLLGITGNQNLAVNLAFNGDFEKAGKGIIEQIQQGMLEAAADTDLTLDQIMNLDFTKSADELGISEKLKEFLQKSVDQVGKIQIGNVLDFEKLVAEYSSVEDKIKAIQNKASAERIKISETYERQRIDVNADTYLDLEDQELAALNASKQRENKAIRDLMSEMLQLTPFWQKLFGDLDELGYRSLTKLSDKAKEVVDSAEVRRDKDNKVLGYTVKLDDKDYDISVELFEKLRKQTNSLDKDLRKSNPFKTLFEDLKEGPKEGEKFGDFAKRISNSLVGIIGVANEVGSSLSGMFAALGDEESAQAIDFAMQLGEAFGNMLSDLSSGNPVQMIGGIINGVAKVVTLFSEKHDNKLEKQIKNSELAVKKLKYAYEDLDRVISKALGEQKYTYTQEQIKNLQEQQKELLYQAEKERQKKKSDKGKIQDLKREVIELNYQIEDLLNNLKDEIIGSTAPDIAKQLGDAFFEAFASGEAAAEAWGNTVNDIIGNVVKNMLISKFIEAPVQEAIDKLYADIMPEATTAEEINKQIEAARKELEEIQSGKGNFINKVQQRDRVKKLNDTIDMLQKQLASIQVGGPLLSGEAFNEFENVLGTVGDDFQKIIDSLPDDIKKYLLGGEGGEGLSKGIKGITEDTALLLASYLNAIRGSVLLQETYMKNIDTNVAGIYQAMGGSPNITTTTTIPPEIIAAISEPFKLNNTLLASIDANMANVHSISANALAQLVMIQANTYNTAMEVKRCADYFESVLTTGHPKGRSGVNVFA